jgi:PadR family transcriptional regulator, regulatory protein PadR
MAGDANTILTGTLDVLVLKALSWAPMHGFEITQWLEEQSRQQLSVKDSALYQALYRLEERGLVKAEWGLTENNRKARYYRLAPAGRAHLKEEMDRILRYTNTVSGILTATPRRAR